MLGRALGIKRWISLVVLTLGVSVVSLPSPDSNDLAMSIHDFSDHFFPRSVHELGHAAGNIAEAAAHLTKRGLGGLAGELTKRSATYEGIQDDLGAPPTMNYSVGVTAVLISTVISGLTGVYFEKVLKDSATPVSVWTRNVQLSFYSIFPALIFGVILNDGSEIAKHGFFDGYNGIVWTAIVFQAVGGVLVSICINYADNIAKNFATSISIVISFVFSLFFFEFKITPSVCTSKPNNTLRFNRMLTSAPRSSSSARPSCSDQPPCTTSPRGNALVRLRLASLATRRLPSTARRRFPIRID